MSDSPARPSQPSNPPHDPAGRVPVPRRGPDLLTIVMAAIFIALVAVIIYLLVTYIW